MVKMLNNAKKIKFNTFFSEICQFIISVFQKISDFLKIFLAKLISKILIDNRKGVFFCSLSSTCIKNKSELSPHLSWLFLLLSSCQVFQISTIRYIFFGIIFFIFTNKTQVQYSISLAFHFINALALYLFFFFFMFKACGHVSNQIFHICIFIFLIPLYSSKVFWYQVSFHISPKFLKC